jgi:hypothetical protein
MVVRQTIKTKLTTAAREMDVVSVIKGIAVGFGFLMIFHLINHFTGFSPMSDGAGSLAGASVAASASARSRARRERDGVAS